MNVPSRTATAQNWLRTPFRVRARDAGESAPHRRVLDPEVHISRISRRGQDEPRYPVQSDLDETTYTCSCGYVFQAAVVTSVDCPHCGDAQAW